MEFLILESKMIYFFIGTMTLLEKVIELTLKMVNFVFRILFNRMLHFLDCYHETIFRILSPLRGLVFHVCVT